MIAVALNLKDKLFQAWEKAKPAISYIATVAIPAVIGAMMKVIGAAATVYQKLDEWGLLIPIITGIAGAVAAVKMVKFAKDTMNTVKAVKALVVVFGAEKKAMIANLALKAKDKLETAYIYALYAKDAVVKGISHMGADGGLDSLERDLCGWNGRYFGAGRGFRISNKSDWTCMCGNRGGYCDRRVAI
mgnify:CR=1 FL=1